MRCGTGDRRLRILGAAPGRSIQVEQGTVLHLTTLDKAIDEDISTVPNRGETLWPSAEPRDPATVIDRKFIIIAINVGNGKVYDKRIRYFFARRTPRSRMRWKHMVHPPTGGDPTLSMSGARDFSGSASLTSRQKPVAAGCRILSAKNSRGVSKEKVCNLGK